MADARSASPRSLFLGGSLGGGVARKRIVAQEYGSNVTVSVAWARQGVMRAQPVRTRGVGGKARLQNVFLRNEADGVIVKHGAR